MSRARSIRALVFTTGAFYAALTACGDSGESAAPTNAVDADVAPNAGDANGDAGPAVAEFGLDTRPPNRTCMAPTRPPAPTPIAFQRVFANVSLVNPMTIAQKPGDTSRWFVAQRDGKIVSFPASSPPDTPTVVADLAALSGPVFDTDEGGLLGFAFHPKFAQTGRLYVSWTSPTESILGFVTSADGGQTFTQHQTILSFPRGAQHHGGGLAFGKDGYLYASFGDGGQSDRGQETTGFDAKVLRIDVDAPPLPGKGYAIPDDNPFKDGGGEPATFAMGLRNPFRLSIDRDTGDLWVGDVGRSAFEEINHVRLGGNYGWPCREGAADTNPPEVDPAQCAALAGLVDPVVAIPYPTAYAITGGVVYRGASIPGFVGTYLYANFGGPVYTLRFDPTTGAPINEAVVGAGIPDISWASFGESDDGEIYAVGYSFVGGIYKLVAASPPPVSTFPDRLSKTGCVDANDPQKAAPGLIPYRVNAELWSDGADKERFFALPEAKTISVGPDGDFELPTGSVLMKTFSVGARRVETRLLVRHDDGDWAGYSYEWNDAQTEAVLLASSKTKTVGGLRWTFPSRAECVRCHTAAAGRTLGLEAAQLDGAFTYPSTNRIANQLRTLEHIGMFDRPLPSRPARIPDPFGGEPVEARARAYLHANCSGCHRPGHETRSDLDLRFTTPLASTKACNVEPKVGSLGVPGAKILAPASPAQSLLSLRPRAQNVNRMPPIATSVVDARGMAVVDEWIGSLLTCP